MRSCVYIVALLLLAGCSSTRDPRVVLGAPPDAPVYTAYNLWYRNPEAVSSLNELRGRVLAFGSQVEILSADAEKLSFRDCDSGRKFTLIYDSRCLPYAEQQRHPSPFLETQLFVQDLLKRICFPAYRRRVMVNLVPREIDAFIRQFLTTRPAELTVAVRAEYLDRIRRGKVVKGMNKAEVLLAYGMPPAHRNPTLENNTWVYLDGFGGTQRVVFRKDTVIGLME